MTPQLYQVTVTLEVLATSAREARAQVLTRQPLDRVTLVAVKTEQAA